MIVMINIIDFIRKKDLNHKKFYSLVDEVGRSYRSDLSFTSPMVWLRLSAKPCFKLSSVIQIFMDLKGYLVSELSDTAWIKDRALLVYIMEHVNNFNRKPQEHKKLVIDLFEKEFLCRSKLE
ncbi:General transcription factor II-I repeat domain-containing protein 2 [Thelohanellus kitauei]|uniref:General transcription factor II-I repeat domain-containing protein 2 n=1 Tax=Thelohanellus kitauei TaxID=669202 RepID=A0A0C2JWB5_THEKT|nr:General transcription factor II-I repeat domain-containing protein 2 [Thelohanellus kitauei]